MNRRGFAIPIRVLISLILVFVITSIFYLSWRKVEILKAEADVKNQIDYVLSEIEIMVASGDARDVSNPSDLSGDKRKFDLNLPEKVDFVAFGFNPEKEGKITGDGSCIFYKIKGGNEKVIWLENIYFRKGKNESGRWVISNEGFMIKNGKYSLIFELVEEIGGKKYVLIYPSSI
ncbi:MAG: hypothetical protein H5T45_05860 [Thermoplasmatales archaeon]|nr:hypothetical protein [Thermoplasmatales archaeon]